MVMKTSYLFPHSLKKIGWALFIPGLLLGILFLSIQEAPEFLKIRVFAVAGQAIYGKNAWFSLVENNVLDEITGLLLIIGALLIAFSKEKTEDEFIARIRLESLVWATYVNYAILVLSILFVYDMSFFWVLVFNMFTILIFFLVRFNWCLYKSKNQNRDEE